MPKPVRPVRGKKVRVDFSGVDTSSGREVPDGQYLLAVESVEEKESSEGNPYLAWTYKVAEGDVKGAKVWDNTSLQPQALWRLAKLLRCLGVDEIEGEMDLDLGSYIGRQVHAEILNETYQGKRKPRVTDFLSTEAGAEEEAEEEVEEEEEEVAKPVAKKKVAKAAGPKLKVGSKVKFTDDEGDVQKGVLTEIDGDTAKIDVKGEEWEVDASEVSPA